MSIRSTSSSPPATGLRHPLPSRPGAARSGGRSPLRSGPIPQQAHRPAVEPPLTWEELLGRR